MSRDKGEARVINTRMLQHYQQNSARSMNTRQLPVQNGEKKLPVSLLNRECRLSEEGREGKGRNKGEYRKEERGEERDEAELRPLKFESYICCWVGGTTDHREGCPTFRTLTSSYPGVFRTRCLLKGMGLGTSG